MNILRKIPEDCTNDQSLFLRNLRTDGHFHSFDLTAATDRLPIVIQKDILAAVIGSERAEA